MKKILISLSLIGFVASAQAAKDPCEKAAYNYAVKTQHEMYPGKEWKKSSPSDPTVDLQEEKSNGFEIWSAEWGVDEECLEGFTLLMRRSKDGKSCAVIKEAESTSRDCG